MTTKTNKLLLAIISTVAISSGVFVLSGSSAEACPFSKKSQLRPDNLGGTPSYTAKGYKIAKTLGGIILGSSLIGSGAFILSRRQRQAQAAKASSYQALEFPAQLSFNNQSESKTEEIANRN